jgi:oxygen-independent coproporphyrinogen III oxidase
LKIEEGTVLGRQLDLGQLICPDDALDREMYYTAIDELGKSGFKHYEISNFARAGFECKHNLVYWNAENYVGLGAGAHSFMNRKRFNNILSIEGYINAVEKGNSIVENTELIDDSEQMAEFVILGLRLIDGISTAQFKLRFDKNIFDLYGTAIEKLVKKELLRIEGDRIKLTSSGLDYANQVFVEFI